MELFTLLSGLDLAAISDHELVDVLAGWERLKSHVDAAQARVMAEMTTRAVYSRCTNPAAGLHDPVKAAGLEVSAAMRWSSGYAQDRVGRSTELVHDLPATLDALGAGLVDAYRARVIADETRPISDPQTRRRVEAEALEQAPKVTGGRLRSWLRARVIAADPQAAEERVSRARRDRKVTSPWPSSGSDCTGSCAISGPLEDLVAFYTALDAAARARKQAGDSRTLDQLRFDILAELSWSALANGHWGCCNPACSHVSHPLGTQRGRPVTVNVTAPFSTLLGLDDLPCDLPGYGPVTAEVARRLAADGTWRRLLTDPASGALLDVGTTRYTPPPELAEHVILRDSTCRFPACSWPARSCDLDHTIPHKADGTGGPTSHDQAISSWSPRPDTATRSDPNPSGPSPAH